MDAELAAMPIIDIDTHYTEPRDLWMSRAPQKLRDKAPRVIDTPEGNEQWVVGDMVLGPPGFTVFRQSLENTLSRMGEGQGEGGKERWFP